MILPMMVITIKDTFTDYQVPVRIGVCAGENGQQIPAWLDADLLQIVWGDRLCGDNTVGQRLPGVRYVYEVSDLNLLQAHKGVTSWGLCR